MRRHGACVAVVVIVSNLPNPAGAFSLEAQLKCTGDAYRLCRSEIPNVEKITACMREQRQSLSPGCRDLMERDEAAAALRNSDAKAQGGAPRR